MIKPEEFQALHRAEDAMDMRMLKVKYARSISAAYRDSMIQEKLAIRADFNLKHQDDMPSIVQMNGRRG